jgi:hypothetical protein
MKWKFSLSTLSKLCKKQFLCLVVLGNMKTSIWAPKHVGSIDVTWDLLQPFAKFELMASCRLKLWSSDDHLLLVITYRESVSVTSSHEHCMKFWPWALADKPLLSNLKTWTDIKGVGWLNISVYTQLPSQLESSQKSSKCLTPMPPVFLLRMILTLRTRALVTMSIAPSLVAQGEPNVHQIICQLYWYAAYYY